MVILQEKSNVSLNPAVLRLFFIYCLKKVWLKNGDLALLLYFISSQVEYPTGTQLQLN